MSSAPRSGHPKRIFLPRKDSAFFLAPYGPRPAPLPGEQSSLTFRPAKRPENRSPASASAHPHRNLAHRRFVHF